MMDVGIVVDLLTDGHAYMECLWIWIPFNRTKVALFGFSGLKFMNMCYFKLKLNKSKITFKKFLVLEPYFTLQCRNPAIVYKCQIILILICAAKVGFSPVWNQCGGLCYDEKYKKT